MRRILEAEPVDRVLPREDGLSLTCYLRGHSGVAIIILTGKGETVDRIIGLEKTGQTITWPNSRA
jgi:DNA-binding response OmpR family regulator